MVASSLSGSMSISIAGYDVRVPKGPRVACVLDFERRDFHLDVARGTADVIAIQRDTAVQAPYGADRRRGCEIAEVDPCAAELCEFGQGFVDCLLQSRELRRQLMALAVEES